MDNFDIKSAKFIVFIIVICGIFAALVGNAYRYLPSENDKNTIKLEQKESPEFIAEEKEYTEEETVGKKLIVKEKDEEIINEKVKREPEKEIEELEVIKPEQDNNDNELDNSLAKAKKYVEDKDYSKALAEYQKALTLANEDKEKALCYEQIANIHAVSKHYGSALSSAQKAFNLAPTTSREVLLARLYYKTGNPERANQRMQNVLQRDFSMDK